MRILFFYQYFGTPKGGWSLRSYEFAVRWVQAGHKVTVVTSVYDKSDIRPEGLISKLDIDGIDVRVLNIRLSNKDGVLKRIWTFAAYALMACWYALVLPTDVVLASSGPITTALPGLVAHYLRRKPFVFEVRDLWPEGAVQLGFLRNPLLVRLARLFEKICYRAAFAVVPLSEGMAEGVRECYPAVRRVEVIPNASDNKLYGGPHDRSLLPEWATGATFCMYSGTMGAANDCGQIVDMARWLKEEGAQDVHVVFTGEGKERPMLEERARQMGLTHVHFLGLVTRETYVSLLQEATVAFVLMRNLRVLDTSSPNKMFDAFAAGTPIVQNTQGWIKKLGEQEGCVVTVPQQDAAAMGQAVLRIVRDDAHRQALSENGLRVARDLFDRDLLVRKMTKLLEQAARARS